MEIHFFTASAGFLFQLSEFPQSETVSYHRAHQEQLDAHGTGNIPQEGRSQNGPGIDMEEQDVDQGGHKGGHDAGCKNPHANGKQPLFPGPEPEGQPHGNGAADEIGYRDGQEIFVEKVLQGGREPGTLPAQVQQ